MEGICASRKGVVAAATVAVFIFGNSKTILSKLLSFLSKLFIKVLLRRTSHGRPAVALLPPQSWDR